MKVSWIGGWGVAPEYLKPLAESYLTGAIHSFLPPVTEAVATVAQSDRIVAWSLGAWRVLDYACRGGVLAGPVVLLAPVVAFCAEDHLGGRVARSQVRWLRRWLERDPEAALRDFRERAGLPPNASLSSADPSPMPYRLADLREGLDRLAAPPSPALCEFVRGGLPARWRALTGDADPLLDGVQLCRLLPGCELVPGASHEPISFLTSLKGGRDAI